MIEELQRKVDEDALEIQRLEQEIRDMEIAAANEEPRGEMLLRERDHLMNVIENAQSICKDLMLFDPEDLAHARRTLNLTIFKMFNNG